MKPIEKLIEEKCARHLINYHGIVCGCEERKTLQKYKYIWCTQDRKGHWSWTLMENGDAWDTRKTRTVTKCPCCGKPLPVTGGGKEKRNA